MVAGIDAPSKSRMCWDLMRIPVRSIAVHQQQEKLGRQNYCILSFPVNDRNLKNKMFNAAQSCLSTSPAGLVEALHPD